MSLQTWLLYLLAAIGLSLSPGPNSLLALTHGALHGPRRTLATVAGGALGFTVLIALSMFGIGALLAASAAWLTALGRQYLAWVVLCCTMPACTPCNAARMRCWAWRVRAKASWHSPMRASMRSGLK